MADTEFMVSLDNPNAVRSHVTIFDESDDFLCSHTKSLVFLARGDDFIADETDIFNVPVSYEIADCIIHRQRTLKT